MRSLDFADFSLALCGISQYNGGRERKCAEGTGDAGVSGYVYGASV